MIIQESKCLYSDRHPNRQLPNKKKDLSILMLDFKKLENCKNVQTNLSGRPPNRYNSEIQDVIKQSNIVTLCSLIQSIIVAMQ